MPNIDMHQGGKNIVQLSGTRRVPAVPTLRVTRPQTLAIVPFEAWISVRDRVAAALLGGTQRLLIAGPAGTGKTVMLEDVGRLLRAAGRTVVVRQADAEPTPPARGETLFVDEADRLPVATLRLLLEQSAGTVVLAGLGTLTERVGAKTMRFTLSPLGQEATREYVALWLSATGRTPEHLDAAGLRQLAEVSGGVPRLLATLLGASAWLAESAGAGTITAGHVREAAELRSVLSPGPDPVSTESVAVSASRGWALGSAVVVVAGLAVVGAVMAPRLLPGETAWVMDRAGDAAAHAERWLGGVSGKPAAPAEAPMVSAPMVSAPVDPAPIGQVRTAPAPVAVALPPITPHVVPGSEAAVTAAEAVAASVAPEPAAVQAPALSGRAEAVVIPTLPSPADAASLPIETLEFLVRRGQAMAAVDDLSAARLLFQRAADGGSAEAMFELARTYDPAVQTGLGAAQADKAEAILWYRRAAAQGVTARARLNGR